MVMVKMIRKKRSKQVLILIQLFLFSTFCTSFSFCRKVKVELEYTDCSSSYETWIDEEKFTSLPYKKDTILLLDISKKELIRMLSTEIDTLTKRIDMRAKITFHYNKGDVKIVYFDNVGRYKMDGNYYRNTSPIINVLKKQISHISCW